MTASHTTSSTQTPQPATHLASGVATIQKVGYVAIAPLAPGSYVYAHGNPQTHSKPNIIDSTHYLNAVENYNRENEAESLTRVERRRAMISTIVRNSLPSIA